MKTTIQNISSGRKGWQSILFALFFILSITSQSLAVDILYSGCTNGHLENCRCPSDPLGALEKRLPEVERRRQLGEVLLLDSGDICPALVDSLGSASVIEAFSLFQYDAVGLGDQDVLQGEKILEKMLEELPVVTANIANKQGKLIAPPFKLIKKSNETFAVTAVIDPSAFHFVEPSLVDYITVLDLQTSLDKVLSSIPEDAKVIVLSHSGMEKDKVNAASWKGVDLIVGGHDQSIIEGVDGSYGIPIVQAGGNSRYMGIARIRGNRVRAELVTIRPELPDDERMIDLIIRHKAAKMRLKQK